MKQFVCDGISESRAHQLKSIISLVTFEIISNGNVKFCMLSGKKGKSLCKIRVCEVEGKYIKYNSIQSCVIWELASLVCQQSHSQHWKNFPTNIDAQFNVCTYILSETEDWRKRNDVEEVTLKQKKSATRQKSWIPRILIFRSQSHHSIGKLFEFNKISSTFLQIYEYIISKNREIVELENFICKLVSSAWNIKMIFARFFGFKRQRRRCR